MDRFDLSRQGISSLAQVSDGIVWQVERGRGRGSGDDDDRDDVSDQYEYALSFAQNRIIEVHAIGRFQRVAQLDLSSNKIVSLEGMQALRKLESVNLARNNLTSVDVLANLPSLRVLSVSENSIVQLDGLRDCRELMMLDASYNNVTKWPLLGDMVTLESLDLSSNLLEAFAPSAAPLLFPDSLRRLSIAKNQIHEMCGIAALGSHLTKLQSLSIEGNGVVNQVAKSRGKLGYLLANFFHSLPVDSTADNEEFLVPRATITAVQRAVQQRNEDALLGFLKTGSAAAINNESAAPMTRKAVVASTIQSSRFKVEELVLPQPPVAVTGPSGMVPNASMNREPARQGPPSSTSSLSSSLTSFPSTEPPAALSKESKMEMWKRITKERRAAQKKEKDRLQRELTRNHEQNECASETRPTTAVGADSPQILPVSTRAHRTAADESMTPPPKSENLLPPPPPPPSPPAPAAQTQPGYSQKQQDRLKVSPPAQKPLELQAHELRGNGGDGGGAIAPSIMEAPNLLGQIKTLNEQVAAIRKYMKVWIKREQMTREAAARRIQRWLRQQRFRQAIARKIKARRHTWREKYALQHYSSSVLLAATRIQRAWRSVLEHRSAILGVSTAMWSICKSRTTAGSHRQSHYVISKLISAVAHFGADVKQLQQVCVVQERAMIELWDNTTRFRRYLDYRISKAVVRFQSLWRGWKARRLHVTATRKPKPRGAMSPKAPDEIETMKRAMELQAQEIMRLSLQVQTLQSAVERLLAERQTE